MSLGEYLGAGSGVTKGLYHLENTTDSSGNSNTLTNNNSVAFGAGLFKNCADFGTANTNKSLSLANNMGYAGGAFTISLWQKLRTEVGVGGVYGMSEVRDKTTSDTILAIFYAESAGVRTVYFRRSKVGTANNDAAYNIALGTSLWYNFILSYDGTTVIGYLNGSNVGSIASSGNGASDAGADQVLIGSGIGFYTSAYIDEAVYENVAWSASKIKKYYTYAKGRYGI